MTAVNTYDEIENYARWVWKGLEPPLREPLAESAGVPSKDHVGTSDEPHISPLRNMFKTNFNYCKTLQLTPADLGR